MASSAREIRQRFHSARRRPVLDDTLQALDREVARTRLAYEQAVEARMRAAKPWDGVNPPPERA